MKVVIYSILFSLFLTSLPCSAWADTGIQKDTIVRLDSWGTKTRTITYDSAGIKTEASYFLDKKDKRWHPGRKTETMIDSLTGEITYLYYKRDEAKDNWMYEGRFEWLTKNGKTWHNALYDWNENLKDWVGNHRQENSYDDQNRNSISTEYWWNKETRSWFISTQSENTFLENGKISQSIISGWDCKKGSVVKQKKVNYSYSCLDNSISSTKVQKWNEQKNDWQDFSFDSTYFNNSNERIFRQCYTEYNEKTGNLDTLKTKTEIMTRDSSYRAEIWWNKNHQKTNGEENRNYRDKDSLFSYNIHIKYGWDEDHKLPTGDKEEYIINTNNEVVVLIRSKWNEQKKRFVIAEKETYCYDTNQRKVIIRSFINDNKKDTLCPFEFKMYTCDYPEKRFYYQMLRFNSTDKEWDYAPLLYYAENSPFAEIIPDIPMVYPEDYLRDICTKTDTLTETGNDSLKHITRETHYLMNAHDENKQMQYKMEYAYDNEGNRILTAYYLPGKQPDTWICTKKWATIYDKEKRPISTAYYALNYETKTLTGVGKEEKAYDQSGQKYMNAYYEWDTTTQSWKGLLKSEHIDDAKGKFWDAILYTWNDKTQSWKNRFKSQTRHDAKGNPLGHTEYIWNEKLNDWIKKPVPKVPRNAELIQSIIE